MLYNSSSSIERLILGHTFLNSYNASMKYDEDKIGLQGFVTPAREKPATTNSVALIVILIVGSVILIGLVAFMVIRKRRANLEKGLSQFAEEGEKALV